MLQIAIKTKSFAELKYFMGKSINLANHTKQMEGKKRDEKPKVNFKIQNRKIFSLLATISTID